MRRFLSKLLGRSTGQAPQSSANAAPPTIAYVEAFEAALTLVTPTMVSEFAEMFKALESDPVDTVHIEVFVDEEPFSLRVFGYDSDMCDVGVSNPIDQANDRFDTIFPIMTPAEMDRYVVWEIAPGGGRVQALEQPTDGVVSADRLLAWLSGAITENRNGYSGRVTVGVHDFLPPRVI